jgi:glucans biosynthesis protein C
MMTALSTTRAPASEAASLRGARDVSLDYLRTTLTLMVVAHHSALAYTTFARFDSAHYLRSTAPVVDSARWLFLDYAENFNDVFFMSLMFLVSGLFVWPALRRSGATDFLRGRLLRLGLPFALFGATLMPLAYYGSWRMAGHQASFWEYWTGQFIADGAPLGPLWFIWLLLLFDGLAAGLFIFWPGGRRAPADAGDWAKSHPLTLAGGMVLVCALVYLPLLHRFGFSSWGVFLTAPFSFQLSRIGLYLAWFIGGVWVGHAGVDRGLLAQDGALARRWPLWVIAGLVAYNLLVFVPRAPLLMAGLTDFQRGATEAVLWVVSCVASSFAFLAMFRGVVRTARPWMESLSRSAYAIYLVHYVFVVWAQIALLGVALPAGMKFLLTLSLAAAFSWVTAQLALAVPGARRIL